MKHFITALFITVAATAQAQTQTDSAALATMTKVQLSKVYITEVQRVTAKLPGICFKDMAGSVPDWKYTRMRYSGIKKSIDKHNEAIMENYVNIIPYADKQEIINAIEYLKTL